MCASRAFRASSRSPCSMASRRGTWDAARPAMDGYRWLISATASSIWSRSPAHTASSRRWPDSATSVSWNSRSSATVRARSPRFTARCICSSTPRSRGPTSALRMDSRTATLSSARRIAASSRRSASVKLATRYPLFASWTTSPLCSNRRRASRTGPRLMPISLATAASNSGAPGAMSPRRMAPCRARWASSTKLEDRTLGNVGMVHPHGLHGRVLQDSLLAVVPAVPGRLHASEGHGHVEPAVAVDPHRSRRQPVGHPVGPRAVLGPHRRGKAGPRGVGPPDHLVLACEPKDRDYRAEDLLAGDGHAVAHPREHGGFHEESRPVERRPAGEQDRALANARLHVADHPLPMASRDERSDHRAWIRRRPHPHGSGPLRESLPELVVDPLLDEQPRPRRAVLSHVAERGPQGSGYGSRQVRVIEHDVRALAAQLEMQPLEVGRAGPDHLAGGIPPPGERHHVDPGVGRQEGAGDLAPPREHGQDPRREPRLGRQLLDPQGGHRG